MQSHDDEDDDDDLIDASPILSDYYSYIIQHLQILFD